MGPDISFEYEGKKYEVDGSAYDVGRIVLPDGRVLEPAGWFESLPPKPGRIAEVDHVFGQSSPEEIARIMNGVVAVEVK